MTLHRTVVGTIAVAAAATGLLAGCGAGDDATGSSATGTSPARSSSAGSSAVDSSTAESSPATAVALPPPYIYRVDWVQTDVGPSLQIKPTLAGRHTGGESAGAEAWQEVLAAEPDADTPGMRAQFDCHWTFARLVDPDKPSWNLEPGRPVVDDSEMIASRCNPGFGEEE
ncbi:DUF2599 domain-containing protein [Gordonia sp. VNK21]|uniref:DUF2599 domain-containing protein n=1 Tax=Gordonia sp. VNK21 TaxID=3382483 RepID=UPI0038D4DA79